ncbi:MAG: amidohydrolase family protein [bacterium]|nr:amidohydrolase family protein [bacterium]
MSHLSPIASKTPQRQPYLLYGGTVLTMDSEATVLDEAEVLLDHGRIVAVGRAVTAPPGTHLLDVQGHLILPGLVQGHVHLGQTIFRGLAEGRRLLAWLRERIWPLEAAHDDESAYWCTLLGAAECLLTGTTTIQDIGLGPGARGNLQAIVDSRLRAIAGKCLMDTGGDLPAALVEDTDSVLAATEALGDEFDGAGDGRVHHAINPRFILSCSDELWRGVRDLAQRRSWPIHTHALEQQDETELVRTLKGGRDEIDYFDDCGVLSTDLRIAHGVHLDRGHYERLGAARFAVVHCPSANLKVASRSAGVGGWRGAGIPGGVGCDGAACNNDLDAFEELRLAALLQMLRNGPESFSGLDALRLATSEGARAIGLGDETGSVEVGKRADLVVLDSDWPELWAASPVDPHDLVAFSGSPGHVRHVFVDGEQLVEDGRLAHLNLATIRAEADRACQALLERCGLSF